MINELRAEYQRRIFQYASGILAAPALYVLGRDSFQEDVLFLIIPMTQAFFLLMLTYNILNAEKVEDYLKKHNQLKIFSKFEKSGFVLDRIVAIIFVLAASFLGGLFYFNVRWTHQNSIWLYYVVKIFIAIIVFVSLGFYAHISSSLKRPCARIISVLVGAGTGLYISYQAKDSLIDFLLK